MEEMTLNAFVPFKESSTILLSYYIGFLHVGIELHSLVHCTEASPSK